MLIYLAGRYGRRLELGNLGRALAQFGHVITARWLSGHHDVEQGNETKWALEDLGDIDDAEVLVCFTEKAGVRGRARGGRHVELGYAIGKGKRVIVVGPRENLFHHFPDVQVVENTAQLLRLLQPGGQHATR